MSSSASSARIEFRKSSGLNITYGVDDRSMPVILMTTSSSRMDDDEWKNICDQVDDILLPLNILKKNLWQFWKSVPIPFAVGLLVGYFFFYLQAVIIVSAFVGPVITLLFLNNKINKAFLDVKHVCEINSQKYADKLISFDFHDDKTTSHGYNGTTTHHDRYILVSIINNRPNVDDDDVEFGATTGVGAGAGVLSLPPAVDAFAATTTTTTIDVNDDVNDVEFGAATGVGAGVGVLSLPPAVDAFAATTTTTTTIDVNDDVNDVEFGAATGVGAGAGVLSLPPAVDTFAAAAAAAA
jgi:hypothetical protein